MNTAVMDTPASADQLAVTIQVKEIGRAHV